MEWSRRQGRIAAAAALGIVAVLAFARLNAFGIWDPWELSVADLARQLAAGEAGALDRPPLTVWLIAQGFTLFGIHEWSGRLPMAMSGLGAVALCFWLVARFAGRRAGTWAALVAGSSPLFLFNARQMLGAAPGFLTSAAVFLCAMSAVFLPAQPAADEKRRRLALGLWLAGLAVSVVLAAMTSGVLLGVAPPLLAAGVAIAARGEAKPPFAQATRGYVALGVLAAAVIVLVGTGRAIWADYADFGLWTGGVPRGGDPPTWEVGIERLFHSFAPWSALLPLALARLLMGSPSGTPASALEPRLLAPYRDAPDAPRVAHPEENALRLGLVAWVAFGFLAQALFAARFGPATFLPLVGAAGAVALVLHDVERTRRGWWGTAVVTFLFVGLIVRDFRAYPVGPIEGLPVEGIEVPEVFNPKYVWAAFLLAFGGLLGLGLAADPSSPHRAFRDDARTVWRLFVPAALLEAQWKRGIGYRIWLVLIGLLTLSIFGFGAAAWVAPEPIARALQMTTLAIRVGRAFVFIVPGVCLAVGGMRFLLFLFAKLGSYRLVPGILAGVVVGGYAALVFQPQLSSHFSPREVYDTYNRLASEGEPLGEFRVGGRAAAYYASGEIVELDSQAELIQFLQRDERVWVAFRADDLASIDRDYRRRSERHVFVADARSARMILATNQPVEGVENQNYLADAVRDEPPDIQHPISVSFDDRIELLGYDLELPHETYVGPGESFSIIWYFRVLAPVPGSYQPFVHIDGPGMRINGDHVPVDGRYPVRLWEPGDIVVDRQELAVPANYRRGNLTIYLGFYAGESRLEVKRGPADEENRARAGVLPVR